MDKAEKKIRKTKPATSPEARERQMIAKAIDCAEKQLEDGTASSQIITHYLKLASKREELEIKKLEKDVELADAKIETLQSAKHIEELYEKAFIAMSEYQGKIDDEE